MDDDLYKELDDYNHNVEERKKPIDFKDNENSSDDFEESNSYEKSSEEEPFNDYLHRIISEIYEYLSINENHPLSASLLSTLSKAISENDEYEITEDDLQLLGQIACNNTTLTVSKYAFACISSLLLNNLSLSHYFVENHFLETIESNMKDSEDMQNCDQLYDLLSTFCKTEFKNYVLSLFNISKMHSYSLNPNFVYTQSFFDYLSCFLIEDEEENTDNPEKYVLTEEDSKKIETFLINALCVQNETILPNLYQFGQELAKKHLIHPSIWETMNHYIRTWSISGLKEFFRFVTTMAFEGCYFSNIDLSFISEIIETYKDNKLLEELITMICSLMESEEFYYNLVMKHPNILIYSNHHSSEGNYSEKSCFIQLLATYLRHISNNIPIDYDFVINSFSIVFQFLETDNKTDLLCYLLESMTIFMNKIKVINPSFFSQIIEDVVDFDLLETFQDSEDESLSEQATSFIEICQ